MTLTTAKASPIIRRTHTATAPHGARNARTTTTTCPFEPEPGSTVSVREWRGEEDLAKFQLLVPTSAKAESFHLQ
jgi:hypothetical protein